MQVDTCKHKPHKHVSLRCTPISCDDGNQHDTEKEREGGREGEWERERGERVGEKMKKRCPLTTLGAPNEAVMGEETNS